MANKIQIKRGLKANLPALSVGELALCTDTNELHMGTDSGTVRVDVKASHTHTKSEVGLGNVDNTADSSKSVASAVKLSTARTIGLSGVTATSQSFDGTGNIIIPITSIPASMITGLGSGAASNIWQGMSSSISSLTIPDNLKISNSSSNTMAIILVTGIYIYYEHVSFIFTLRWNNLFSGTNISKTLGTTRTIYYMITDSTYATLSVTHNEDGTVTMSIGPNSSSSAICTVNAII